MIILKSGIEKPRAIWYNNKAPTVPGAYSSADESTGLRSRERRFDSC